MAAYISAAIVAFALFMFVSGLLLRIRRHSLERRRAEAFRDTLTPSRLAGLERFVR
jgi:hypothetical protein